MRTSIGIALCIALVLLTAGLSAQDGGQVYRNNAYRVQVNGPAGWKQVLAEPKPAGTWLELVRYEEAKSGAYITLSVQSTNYRTSKQMIAALTKQFQEAGSLAVLRREERAAEAGRPKGILFEYTSKGSRGANHSLVTYWFFQGRRYRIFGRVREAAWRTTSGDMERFIGSLKFTGRTFAKKPQNFRDDKMNFAIYYPETWSVHLRASGPHVTFTSDELGVAVWIYVTPARGNLKQEMARLIPQLEDRKSTITNREGPETHPILGVEAMTLAYERGEGDKKNLHRETVILHRKMLYRIVLAGRTKNFPAGEEDYERMVAALEFMK